MKPISIEVIAPVLTDLRHCAHCEVIFGQTEVGKQVHREELDEYPQDLKEDFERQLSRLYRCRPQGVRGLGQGCLGSCSTSTHQSIYACVFPQTWYNK